MKTWLLTPAFCKWEMLSDFLEHVYKTPPEGMFQHVILGNHFPVNKEENQRKIQELAERYGCRFIDSGGDLGLHRSVNNACKIIGISREDILVGCDADDRPSPGFIKAFSDVMSADPKIVIAGATFWVIDLRFREGKLSESMIAGHRVWTHQSVEMWNIAAFRYSFIDDIGGLGQAQPFYGGLEAYLFPKWSERQMKLVYLPDVRSDAVKLDQNDTRIFDLNYRAWKDAHGGGAFTGSFYEWLCKNGNK